jgi:integrase/recombinase XerC
MSVDALTLAEATRIVREATRDKSYQATPLGEEVAAYLRSKRKRLTEISADRYERTLAKLAYHFADLEPKDFEPPVGTERVEEFMEHHWGGKKPATYNQPLSIVSDFFKWQVRRGRLHGDPTLPIEPARKRDVEREVFSADERRAIIASADELRDRVALRLLMDYGLRKGSLQKIRFKHFDHVRRRLTVFSKGGKVRRLPIPDSAFWVDLERLILDSGAEGHHYLLQRVRGNQSRQGPIPDQPMGKHGLHLWWYRALARAGIVPEGTTSGERMHKARHSAGQRLLDHTGNLVAVKQLLGHKSIKTTADVYTDWDEQRLAESLLEAMQREQDE